MEKEAKIYVAGHRGLVGAAILRRLQEAGFKHLIYRQYQELDLRNQAAVAAFFAQERPERIISRFLAFCLSSGENFGYISITRG
jgi:GDP-L-fucose synthase